MPLVSIIIPAFRQPDFLNHALRSLAAQTHTEAEILIIDDASGPEFTSRYHLPPNATLITHATNRAIAAVSRNEALAIARGTYITFLDQDDLYLPEKIAHQVAALEAHPHALLHVCHYTRINESAQPLPQSRQDRPFALQKNPARQFIFRNPIHCPAQVMLRRSAFTSLGLFDESIRGAADYDMWLRAALHSSLLPAPAILASPLPLVLYRHHPHQWSAQSLIICRGTIAVLEKTLAWSQQHNPSLIPLTRTRLGRWYRELARAQLRSEKEKHLALASLKTSLKLRPLNPHTYLLLPRALLHAERPPKA